MVDSGPLPQLLGARHRLDEVVAQTAIATVYRAWHVTLNIPTAVKVLRRGAGDWSQIEREVKSLVVGELVMEALKKLDQVAYVRFASVYRSFQDIAEFRNEIERLEAEPARD